MKFKSVDELLTYTWKVRGRTFKEFDVFNLLDNSSKDKVLLKKIIEMGFYKYETSDASRDNFDNLDIELKVCGYVRNKSGDIFAKERVVLDSVNYYDLINEEFDFNKLIFKNKKLLIIWYEYDYKREYKDFVISDFQLYDMTNDEDVIRNDFSIIKNKVLDGKAHLISEGDTAYLGACVRNVDCDSKVCQPFSEKMAKPRYFCLKQSYLNGLLKGKTLDFDLICLYKTVEDYVYSQIKNYIGKTQMEIYLDLFNLDINDLNMENIPKNFGKMISDKIFGLDQDLDSKNVLLSKTNHAIKNVPVDSKMVPLERMAFRTFSHSDFITDWNDSEWKSYFEELTIIAICYEGSREVRNGYRTLKTIKKITFNDSDIDSFGKTYNMVKAAIEAHDISLLPYPGSFTGQFLEVAPKGQKGADAYTTFFEKDKTKVCFMLNKSFLTSKFNDGEKVDSISEKEDNISDDIELVDDVAIDSEDIVDILEVEEDISDDIKLVDDVAIDSEDTVDILEVEEVDVEAVDSKDVDEKFEEFLNELSDISFVPDETINFNDYNLCRLYNYGINLSLIETMLNSRISVYNIYFNGMGALASLNISDNKKNSVILAVNKMIESKDKERSIYELNYQGLSKILCERLNSVNISIKELYTLDKDTLKEKYDVGNVISDKIKAAISANTIIFKECNNNVDSSSVLEKYLKENTMYSEISVFDLKNKLKQVDLYNLENFNRDFDKLSNENKIVQNMFGVRYNYIKFKDYLLNSYDEKRALLFIDRLNGETLQTIADKNSLTRERVRQICAKLKIFDIKETFYEDKYENIFKKYAWTKELFMKIFDEEEFTYNFLLERYNVGTVDLSEIITDDYFSNKQKQIYKENRNVSVAEDGSIIYNEKHFLKRFVMKYAQDEIVIDDLCEIYNQVIDNYPELKLTKTTPRSFEGKLSRCEFVFSGLNRKVRYLDFDSLSDESVEQLQELIILSDGFYSTEYLFRNNLKLMEELDIRNEYELHNILKWRIDTDDNNVYFTRMPNFLVEYKERDIFILDKIKEYSPIKVEEFVDMLYEDYGHKKQYMYSYLLSNFYPYVKNGYFDIETKKLAQEDYDVIAQRLFKPIYPISEVEGIFKNLGYDNFSEIFTNYNFSKIGYKLKSGFIIRSEYTGVYNYLDFIIEKKDMIRIDEELLKCGSIYNAINFYLSERKLYRMTNQIFITNNKLLDLGISSDYIDNLVDTIKINYSDKDYFSVNNVMNDLEIDKLINIGLTDEFLESLISSMNEVTTLRINNYKLFTLRDKKLSIRNFMYEMASKYRSISLNELENEIRRNYQIVIPAEKLREYLYGTDIFYSDILEKIYNDSEDYYVEVYDE